MLLESTNWTLLSWICDAWDQVLARHSILRSTFINHVGGARIYQSTPPRVAFVKQLDIRTLINDEFDLEQECPVRITLSPRYLVICISHIVCDLTTLRVLEDEVHASYRGQSLATPTKSYENTIWSAHVDHSVRNFWKTYLQNCIHSRPRDDKPTRHTFNGTSYTHKFTLSAPTTLHSTIAAHNLTHHQAVLAVVALALQPVLSSDVVIGGPYLGRSEDDEDTIGLFLQPLPIAITKTSTDTPLFKYLASVRESSQLALANVIPWKTLLEHLSLPSDALTSPICDVMVTFHDERNSGSRQLIKQGFKEMITWSEGAKFPLMLEFTLADKFLMLRIEYSAEMFTREEVVSFVRSIGAVLQSFGDCGTVGEVLQSVRDKPVKLEGCEVAFGSRRCEL
jgi:hypothetical protein